MQKGSGQKMETQAVQRILLILNAFVWHASAMSRDNDHGANIMVRLKNIKKTNEYITAEYFPEDGEKRGYMKVRCSDGEIIEHINAGMCSAAHVRRQLYEFASRNDVPSEYTVMWY